MPWQCGPGVVELPDDARLGGRSLMHALLLVEFEDVRAESWNPTYMGGASRVDFLVREAGIVVEVKKTRAKLADREVGSQLAEDVTRYSDPAANRGARILVCFVYDPDRLIANPRGLERDLAAHGGRRHSVIASERTFGRSLSSNQRNQAAVSRIVRRSTDAHRHRRRASSRIAGSRPPIRRGVHSSVHTRGATDSSSRPGSWEGSVTPGLHGLTATLRRIPEPRRPTWPSATQAPCIRTGWASARRPTLPRFVLSGSGPPFAEPRRTERLLARGSYRRVSPVCVTPGVWLLISIVVVRAIDLNRRAERCS
jgi:hypothetical protein